MPDPAIPFETLVAYASGELTPADAEALLGPLDAAGLAAAAKRLQRVIATLQGDDSEAPTAAAIRRALAEFRPDITKPSRLGAPLAELRRIVAELVFDSRGQAALAGFRGGGATYQLGFQSDLGRVGVQIMEPDSGASGWRVRGQVLGGKTASRVALVTPDDDVVATATPDDTGQFTIEATTGSYELHVEFADRGCVLVMPEVQLS